MRGGPGLGDRFRWVLAGLAALALALGAAAQPTPDAGYRLGIFPYLAPRQTVEFFGPVAADMQAVLKHPVRLESVPTFPEFTRQLAALRYDIALIQPFDYSQVVDKLGYLPLAQLAVPLVSQFYVRDDSAYRTIEDLRGTVVAMPPAQAASARMTLRALHDNNLLPGRDVEVRHFNSHDSCIQQVWAGSASACGTARPPILVFEQRMQAKLRAIHDTPPVPHALFVAHPRVPIAQRAKLHGLIVGWSQTDAGRVLLKNLGLPGFVAPRSDEYAVMRDYDPATAGAKAALAGGKDLVLGVFPFLPPRQLAQNFAPALPALGKVGGVAVHFRSATSFDSFLEAIAAASYDIVVVQPFDVANAASHGYLPLAGMKEPLQGSFFVLGDSADQQIADLRGKVVAMAPADAALSRLGRHALVQAGLTPERDVRIDYRPNHDSCLQQLRRNVAAACVTSARTLGMVPRETGLGLRSIGQTETVPGAAFMAHARVPEKARERLQAEIVSWQHSDDGRKILRSIGMGAMVPVTSADYQRLPRLEASR